MEVVELVADRATLIFPFPISRRSCPNTPHTNDQGTTHAQRPAPSVKDAWEQVGREAMQNPFLGLNNVLI